MRFRYQAFTALPPLAWCARVVPESDTILVLHGAGVETHPRGFVEGAWNGSYSSFDIATATIVAGTGGMLEVDRVRFVASTDHSGPLFSISQASTIHVSNSPAFAMVASDESLDDIYPFYPYDLVRIFRGGLDCPDGEIVLHSGASLRVHFTTILSVDKSGSVSYQSHPLCEPPHDYSSYRSQLSEGVSRMIVNASDPARTRRYRPLASLSKGYDSTATAVLARSAGCMEALTFTDHRRLDPRADSGAENARSLGMECREYDRWQYLDLDGRAEAEFGYVATGSVVPLAAAEEQLAGRLLIGGEYGDVVWDPHAAKASDRLRRPSHGYTMGLSTIESRLRVGYCMFAPACIGARHNRRLYSIALSQEMQPWSIGGDYDRPIARRIAEEAGLQRERVGMMKLASWHSHLIYPGRYSTRALNDYRAFVSRRHDPIHRDIYRYWRARVDRLHGLWDRLASRQQRHPVQAPNRRMTIPIRVPWPFMFTFQWAVQAMRGRYAVAALRGR